MRPATVGLILIVILAAAFYIDSKDQPAPGREPSAKAATEPKSPPLNPWAVDYGHDELTGVRSMSAKTFSLDATLVIRRIGKKFDCFVITNKFMETIESVESHKSTVRYRFDNGPIETSSWIIGADNESLFVPGNAESFLRRLSKAKTFVIQYEPYGEVKQSTTFHLDSFPMQIFLPKQQKTTK